VAGSPPPLFTRVERSVANVVLLAAGVFQWGFVPFSSHFPPLSSLETTMGGRELPQGIFWGVPLVDSDYSMLLLNVFSLSATVGMLIATD